MMNSLYVVCNKQIQKRLNKKLLCQKCAPAPLSTALLILYCTLARTGV